MADARRIKRLEAAMLQAIAPMISHGLTDPRLGMVTVTRIRLSRDLSVARVNWSLIGDEADRSKAAHALEHARGHLQGAVAARVKMRITPHLEFHYDPSMEHAVRVNAILDQIARERAEREGPPEEDGEAMDEDGDDTDADA